MQDKLFITCCYLIFCANIGNSTNFSSMASDYEFPSNFKFGVSTAAFQIEGGWNEDGRGPSIWDVGIHQHPEKIADHSNADVADNSYHLFDRDLEMLKELRVNLYRFSISWSRVMPNGDRSSLNKKAIQYYNYMIDRLIENSIEPMVTMYHYDLPEELQKIGGLTNELFPKYFEIYADTLFGVFGDRVKLWATFNEPYDYCHDGYDTGTSAPFIELPGIGGYLCVDNTLKAHALAFHLYKRNYFKAQKGKIGIVISSQFLFSKTNDADIADRGMQFTLGWIGHPIFSQAGGYPEVMIREIASNSQSEGRAWSRLPDMTEEWKNLIRGSADFFGLNYYSSRYVELSPKNAWPEPSMENDARLNRTIDPAWKRAKSKWLYSVPDGLRDLLRWIKDEYENVEVFVAENGWSDDGQIEDDDRITYLQDHVRAVAEAINKYQCNVVGYSHWSLMDNFEWLAGYTERFGLYNVDFSDPNRKRVPKKSVAAYSSIIKNRKIPSGR